MIKYQVQSKVKYGKEWLDDRMPFDSIEEAKEYIASQPRCFHYRIIEEDYGPEPGTQEYFDINDCWDAVGGDWEG